MAKNKKSFRKDLQQCFYVLEMLDLSEEERLDLLKKWDDDPPGSLMRIGGEEIDFSMMHEALREFPAYQDAKKNPR